MMLRTSTQIATFRFTKSIGHTAALGLGQLSVGLLSHGVLIEGSNGVPFGKFRYTCDS